MMRFTAISMASAFLAAVLTMALWPDNTRFGTPGVSLAQETDGAVQETPDSDSVQLQLSEATQRDLKTEDALKRIVDLEFEETPFGDIMDHLRELTGVNFLIDNSARDDALSEDEPLTFDIRQLPLNKSLDLMLVEKNATYIIDEGVVVFISRDIADDANYMRLKMFDCRKLIHLLPLSDPTNLAPTTKGGHPDLGLHGLPLRSPLASDSTSDESSLQSDTTGAKTPAIAPTLAAPKHATCEATLLNIVFSMVDPDSWEQNGGMASAQFVNGILVVRQKESAFRKIENLFEDLRANVLNKDIAEKVSTGNSLDSQRVQPSASAGSTDHPLEGAGNNPFGKPRKDPFSSDGSEFGKDPFKD